MAGQTFRQFADQLSTRRRPISYAGVYQWKKTGNLPSEWVREIARLSGYKESALHEDFR